MAHYSLTQYTALNAYKMRQREKLIRNTSVFDLSYWLFSLATHSHLLLWFWTPHPTRIESKFPQLRVLLWLQIKDSSYES